jgi:Mrp family chromosome partitioning ATPase/uncharacterized protein involved in exopolysaccharide biosynthesis
MNDPGHIHDLVPAPPRHADLHAVVPARSSEPEQVNVVKLLHRLLRGRYPFVIVLGVLLVAAGAVTGYVLGIPKYRADALIRIQPRMPRILYESEQTSVTPMFSSFVSTQASLVKQDRVITRAMNSEEWRRLGRPNTPQAQDDFRDSVRVVTNQDAPELISVSFVDIDAVAAKIGLEQTLRAYEAIFGQAESRQVTQFQLATLESRRRTLTEDITRRRQDIRTIAAEYGTEDLAQLHGLKMDHLLVTERRLGEVELALAQIVDKPGAAPAGEAPADLPPDEIARVDQAMAGYLAKRREFEKVIEALKARGFGAQHPDYQQVEAEIAALDLSISAYANAWNADRAAGKLTPSPGGNGLIAETPDQLRARLEALKTQAARARADVVELGNKRLDIEARQREIANLTTLLDEVNRRIDEVNVEAKVEQTVGRIEVILPEAVPAVPTDDPRKKYAAFGGTMGGGLVMAFTLLVGLIDRRFRYSDELTDTTKRPLLACLPLVTDRKDEEALGAAHNIHRIRALLQIASPGHRTIVITSPSPGEGKTSVCISLGMSFAAVGERTLLVDLDLIGRGLTSRLALRAQVGLHAALAGTPVDTLAAQVRAPHLFALPIEHLDGRTPSSLRRDDIRTLLDDAARTFSCIIVDTGPILGSLEANYAAAAADGVVLVISRGQPRSNFERAVSDLRQVGARILGIVFNRARTSDFRHSNPSASIRFSRPTQPGTRPPPSQQPSIDPLADVVADDLVASPGPDAPASASPFEPS